MALDGNPMPAFERAFTDGEADFCHAVVVEGSDPLALPLQMPEYRKREFLIVGLQAG